MRNKIFSALTLFLITFGSNAGVNLKNGNYFITYRDIQVPGKNMEVLRTYNSHSAKKQGRFGLGQGSPFETYLRISPDGRLALHNNGTGAITFFHSQENQKNPEISRQKMQQEVAMIMDKLQSRNSQLQKRLLNNAYLRYQKAEELGLRGAAKMGTTYVASARGQQKITVTPQGFTLSELAGNKKRLFNKQGKLISIVEDQERVDLSYLDNKIIIKGPAGKQMTWLLNPQGLVKEVLLASLKDKVSYTYKKGYLVKVVDPQETFTYDYDSQGRLARIGYQDQKSRKIEYNTKGQVTQIVEPSGKIAQYNYQKNSLGNKLSVTTKKISPQGKVQTSRYQYHFSQDQLGHRTLAQMDIERNGKKTQFVYATCCNQPREITYPNGDKKVFTFNAQGKKTQEVFTRGQRVLETFYSYDEKNRLTKIQTPQRTTTFKYSAGQLVETKTFDGVREERIALIYNPQGNVSNLVDIDQQNKRVFSFEYDANQQLQRLRTPAGDYALEVNNYGKFEKITPLKEDKKKASEGLSLFFHSLNKLHRSLKHAGAQLNMFGGQK